MPRFEFLTEQWKDQNDSCYISEYECEQDCTDILACPVSPATKAKFKFPSKDPTENIIKDTRSDSEKVTDILRIWSQLLGVNPWGIKYPSDYRYLF